jgi:hypothetical protein
MSAPMRQAALFADAALRRVLEVIDRRRSVAQLRPLLTPRPVAHRGPDTAAEVFGSYSRGRRVHAIACRVEQVPAGNGTRWQVVALHIG